jgi:hypothetical protein
MTSKASSFILSVSMVVLLNTLVLVLCALSVAGLIPTSTDQPLFERLFPSVAPALTVFFLLARKRNRFLATLALLANGLVLTIALAVLALMASHSTSSATAAALGLLLLFVFFCVFVPLVSGLAVASRWPSARVER